MKRRINANKREFDDRKYKAIIDTLDERTPGREVEKACERIAIDILQNYERFERIEKGPNFVGTPFDFFGFKNNFPYMIELKCSLNYFGLPDRTQKRRMRELLHRIRGLKAALLQVKLKAGEYRILYDDDMRILFQGKKAPIKPIENWIRNRL